MSAVPILGAVALAGAGVLAYRKLKKDQQRPRNKKVLFVITSWDKIASTGKPTGVWLEEFVTPYYLLKDAGFEVVMASPRGGKPPIDPKSEESSSQTEKTRRFKADSEAMKLFENTHALKEVDESNFCAVFFPGGHGPLWDLAEDPNCFWLIEKFHRSHKPIAAVCHGPAVFKHTPHVVKGMKVTGFSNAEESQNGSEKTVPFLLEDMLKQHGARYSCGQPWGDYMITDGLLITGQNPASSESVGKALVKLLKQQ